jgi:SAM-dependent methyltransferase
VDERLGRVYDEMARSYADHATDSPYNAHYDRPSVLELCGDVAGLDILDACCGPGLYLPELLSRGARVAAFDASAPMVDLARARVGDAADVRQAVLGEPLPYQHASFDLVVCALAIHYLEDPTDALAELHRVLRPDGALVLSTQHPTTDWLRKGGSYFDTVLETDVWRRDGAEWEVSYWRTPLTELCASAYRSGFLIERLVEPLPAETMRARWPDEDEELRRRPGFLNLRLVRSG